MRLPHRLQGKKVKSQRGAGAYCGGDLAAQLVTVIVKCQNGLICDDWLLKRSKRCSHLGSINTPFQLYQVLFHKQIITFWYLTPVNKKQLRGSVFTVTQNKTTSCMPNMTCKMYNGSPTFWITPFAQRNHYVYSQASSSKFILIIVGIYMSSSIYYYYTKRESSDADE